MHAIIVDETHESRPLVWRQAPDPEPAEGEVVVDVRATALNRADLAQRAGNYPPPPGASEILGLEAAGTIRSLGEGVTGQAVGDEVCALLTGGGYAEQVAVPAAMLMPIPRGWSLLEAAAMPEAFFTAYLNLFIEGDLASGETVLIHGGASGVGMAAIQLAREAGCRVLATAGSDDKVEACRKMGAEVAVNYRREDFGQVLAPLAAAGGVHVVLDMVGKEYLERNVDLLATSGRLVFIATLSGSLAQIDIRKLMAKRLTLKGSTLRARPLTEKTHVKEELAQRFWGHFESGRIKPVIDSVYRVQEAQAAHERMASNLNTGKIVLEVR